MTEKSEEIDIDQALAAWEKLSAFSEMWELMYDTRLADIVPSNSQVGTARADSIADWVARVKIKTSGDTVWRKATEDDWWAYRQLGYLRDALRMGVAPPERCRYRGPNWYGEENLQYLTSIRHWAVDPGHRLVVDDPNVPSMWQFLFGGRGYGKGYSRKSW